MVVSVCYWERYFGMLLINQLIKKLIILRLLFILVRKAIHYFTVYRSLPILFPCAAWQQCRALKASQQCHVLEDIIFISLVWGQCTLNVPLSESLFMLTKSGEEKAKKNKKEKYCIDFKEWKNGKVILGLDREEEYLGVVQLKRKERRMDEESLL